jgi:hypothetical protein
MTQPSLCEITDESKKNWSKTKTNDLLDAQNSLLSLKKKRLEIASSVTFGFCAVSFGA